MVAGRQINTNELNAVWGTLATDLHSVMQRILEAKAVLDGYSAADLQTAPFAYNSTDATLLKSAATDMGDLATLFAGGASAYLTGTHDFRTFAKRLLGPGTY